MGSQRLVMEVVISYHVVGIAAWGTFRRHLV